MFCRNCGQPIGSEDLFCKNCGSALQDSVPSEATARRKSRIAAGLLGLFLGVFGIHNFYLGYTGKAISQLFITVLSCGTLCFVSLIWGFIEGMLLLCGNIDKDASGFPLYR